MFIMKIVCIFKSCMIHDVKCKVIDTIIDTIVTYLLLSKVNKSIRVLHLQETVSNNKFEKIFCAYSLLYFSYSVSDFHLFTMTDWKQISQNQTAWNYIWQTDRPMKFLINWRNYRSEFILYSLQLFHSILTVTCCNLHCMLIL